MLAHLRRERRQSLAAHLMRRRVGVSGEGRGARVVRGNGHAGRRWGGGGSCLGGTSSGAEVSDSPTELRQRTRKRKAWSLRTLRRFELTFEIQGRYRRDIGEM